MRFLMISHLVEPEGFEPSSKHGTRYAFYVLSICLIVGKGKVSCLPVPSSLGVLFRQLCTPLSRLFSFYDAPIADPMKRKTGGTKAMLILN
jgi:hypothetical protein